METHAETTLKATNLTSAVEVAAGSDARLVMLVGTVPGILRSAAFNAAESLGWRTVDLNHDLTRGLLPHTTSERRELAWDAFEEVIGDQANGLVLVTTDILFEPALGYRPYEAIRRIARRGPVIAAWFGTVEGAFITRAQPGHPEYVRARLDVPYLQVSGKKGAGD